MAFDYRPRAFGAVGVPPNCCGILFSSLHRASAYCTLHCAHCGTHFPPQDTGDDGLQGVWFAFPAADGIDVRKSSLMMKLVCASFESRLTNADVAFFLPFNAQGTRTPPCHVRRATRWLCRAATTTSISYWMQVTSSGNRRRRFASRYASGQGVFFFVEKYDCLESGIIFIPS
jgi:hypothetical protein